MRGRELSSHVVSSHAFNLCPSVCMYVYLCIYLLHVHMCTCLCVINAFMCRCACMCMCMEAMCMFWCLLAQISKQEFRGAWWSHRLPNHSFPALFSPLSAVEQLLAAVGGSYECEISQHGLCAGIQCKEWETCTEYPAQEQILLWKSDPWTWKTVSGLPKLKV